MPSDSPKTSKTPELMGRLNMCEVEVGQVLWVDTTIPDFQWICMFLIGLGSVSYTLAIYQLLIVAP